MCFEIYALTTGALSSRRIAARTLNSGFITGGSVHPGICCKVRIPSGVFGVASLALYASAPNHVFGQMLGLSGSWVCRLTFRYYRLRWPKENYCYCALVIPDEHLSRESRKLTVMMQRETVQPLEDSPESLGFLRINEWTFPGHVHMRPYSDAREGTRGYIVAPTLESRG